MFQAKVLKFPFINKNDANVLMQATVLSIGATMN